MSKGKQTIFDNVTPDNLLRTKLGELLTNVHQDTGNRTFHFGEVISTKDPTNTNRIKVRIPLIDDIFYLNKESKIEDGIGDDDLPWCFSSNSRFVTTPEEGSIVLLALIDPRTPYWGRVWFSVISEETQDVMLSVNTLKEDLNGDNNWKNAEVISDLSMSATPGERGRKKNNPKKNKVNYLTGVRGKDKNKLSFDKGETTLIQNEGESNESKLQLTEDALLRAKKLNLLSSNNNRKESPVFADPLFDFLKELLSYNKDISNLLATSPGVGNIGINVLPSPQAPQLVAKGKQLDLKLKKLTETGKSKDITIN